MDKWKKKISWFGVIYLNSKGFYQLLMIHTIVMLFRLKALITERQNNCCICVFIECVFTHTRYCVQVKLCYVKRLFIRLGIHFGNSLPHTHHTVGGPIELGLRHALCMWIQTLGSFKEKTTATRIEEVLLFLQSRLHEKGA